MSGKSKTLLPLFVLTVSLTACAPRRLDLPSGPGIPAADYAAALASARAPCEAVRVVQGELGLSGRALGQRVRGRVLAGFVPGALRLEGVAPFGSPVFILVADDERGTLLLSRERRVVKDERPEDILDALIGIKLGPDDLRSLLMGCVKAMVQPLSARAYGKEWLAVDLEPDGVIYLRLQQGSWRIVAGRHGSLAIDYTQFADGRPSRMVLNGTSLNLAVSVNQVEINGELPRDQLVTIRMPDDVSPLSLDELRKAGPLGH